MSKKVDVLSTCHVSVSVSHSQPQSVLKILYFNARSLLPKLDELVLIVHTQAPDVICITESWLCPEFQESEVSIPGYQLLRLDRDRHGGGVVMFILYKFLVKRLPSHPLLELLTITLHSTNYKLCLSLFYRPPSSSMDVLCALQCYLEEINISQFTNFVLLGDFNINFLDVSNPLYTYLMNISFTFGLCQVVESPTHINNGCAHSLIDLVFISNSSFLSFCQTIPPLSTSDHLGLLIGLKMKFSPEKVRSQKRVVWRYSSADWDKAREMIDAFDWNSLVSEDVNLYWSKWREAFLSIMRECIPTAVLPSQCNLPWLNSSIKLAMRKRDRLFRKFGYCAKFRSARNQVTAMLRKAKLQYFKNLNPSNPKQFWKTVKLVNKKQSTIPNLVCDGNGAMSDGEKAEALAAFFLHVLTTPVLHQLMQNLI